VIYREVKFWVIAGAVVLGCFAFWSNWRADRYAQIAQDQVVPLQANEVRRWNIDIPAKRVIIQTQTKPTVVKVGVRKVVVTEEKNGQVVVHAHNKGLVFEPGLSASAGNDVRIGADVQFAYWRRWGLVAGISTVVDHPTLASVNGHVGVSYGPVVTWAPNTSLFAGINTQLAPVVGIRVQF